LIGGQNQDGHRKQHFAKIFCHSHLMVVINLPVTWLDAVGDLRSE
jgi:hypothetical protein